jgi:predicted DNA repair protein MutK
MQKGYYDCSSLVWRSYKYAGTSLMSSTYAPVAADLGKWIVQKKKKVKGGLSYKNVQAMKLNAGDLMFETGENNGRYKGIYHVEMITGYSCVGFDSDGNPELVLTWASRPDGAYGYSTDYLVGRP